MNIQGLSYIPNFIDSITAAELIKNIDENVWLTDLKRRVQHYGYKYDYRKRAIDNTMKIGEIPNWLIPICEKLVSQGYFESLPDQVIINEYESGQGISAHIDCTPCFKDTIVSLSLGSSVNMEFTRRSDKVELGLEPRSVVILQDEARYNWYHCIPNRKFDIVNGISVKRSRRISITFRQVIIK